MNNFKEIILGSNYEHFVTNIFPNLTKFSHHYDNVNFAASLAIKSGFF